MPVSIDLSGQTALVTGGGSGIGQQTCLLLARAGADVLVLDRDRPAAEATAELVREVGVEAFPCLADVTDLSAVRGALDGRAAPTIVVNNAFWAAPGPFHAADPADDEKTLRVIALGTMTVSRAVLPAMLEAAGGSIVNIMSEAGRIGEANMVAYSTAKAAVGGFTKALAKEVGPSGVRVNAVSPGTTRTPATSAILDDAALSRLTRSYPLRRLGEPTDIASAVLFLASSLSSWVTGQVLSVSGGFSTV